MVVQNNPVYASKHLVSASNFSFVGKA
jgi:hypothetical protein